MKFKHVRNGYYVRNYGSEFASSLMGAIIIVTVMAALGIMTLAIMG